MYLPKQFEQSDLQVLQALIRSKPLANVVTLSSQGLNANPLPLYFTEKSGMPVLQGHVARSNSLWRDFDASVEALAIFQGVDAYISPSFYPSKAEHGKVVPTWNYIALHVYGSLRVVDDPVWLRTFLDKLTTQQEANFANSWQIADAPADYIDKMLKAIVGIELEIIRWEGKWKLSQNKSDAEYQGVADGLAQQGYSHAQLMAALMKQQVS
jgi:transcriptional regulator